jgi:uncharacterized protein
MDEPRSYTAFAGDRLIASGPVDTMLSQLKNWADRGPDALPLVFDDHTGRQVDFDLRGTVADVLARAVPTRGPGRPKLGVVAREISLLPRHWEWLEAQPNGASAAIRRLVDEAKNREPDRQRARHARDATSRMLTALAGNLPWYEEATRALYAGDGAAFQKRIARWPADIRDYALRLAKPGLSS